MNRELKTGTNLCALKKPRETAEKEKNLPGMNPKVLIKGSISFPSESSVMKTKAFRKMSVRTITGTVLLFMVSLIGIIPI